MSENIFDANGQETPPVVEAPKPPVLPDSLKDLVGEGKKYATVEKALESIPHKETHIDRIERENAELRQKMAEAVAAEEVYKKLTESFNPQGGVTPPASGLDEASIVSLLDKRLAEKEAERIATQNVNKVKEALVGKYGDKAQEMYEAKARELGVGVQFLNEVVRRSPKAAEELFGITPKERGGAPSTPGINTTTLNNRPAAPKPARGPLSGGDLLSAWRAAKPETGE